jgi:uncharacterized delta-60 repeat protein
VPLPDGSVVLAGRVDTGNNDEFAEFYQSLFLIKFDASGKLDKTFGRTGDGLSDPTHFGGEEPPHSALLTTDGKIVVSTGFSPHQVAMSRFTTAGLLDETFGDRGTVHVVIDKLAGRDAVSNVLQQGDGKLLLAGGSADAAPLVKLMRFNGTDGSPDLTFGHAGATKIPLDQDLGLAVALGFSSDGSILMGRSAGHFVEDDHHILVSRFWRDEAPVANYVPHNRSSGGTTALRFTIAWRDDDGVDASSIDNGDVQIITPGGAKLRAIVEGRQMLNGQLVVTYKMKPPGGTWRSSANGRYTVRLLSNRVADTAGNFTRGRTLGTFRVRVS